jgi:hypothetical protein
MVDMGFGYITKSDKKLFVTFDSPKTGKTGILKKVEFYQLGCCEK